MRTTILLTVSRPDHLPRVFHALEELVCDRQKVNLLTYVDGDAALYLMARNFTEASKFAQRLCVQRPDKTVPLKFDIKARRQRIADIHNEVKQLVPACDYVLLVEDDTVVPPLTLKRLLAAYSLHPFAGFVEGVELGRWGIPYIGAWRANDVYETTALWTLPVGSGVQEIDAGGFYCTLTKYSHYTKHTFKPYDDNALGPDVEYGLALRQQGLKNYIDWSVVCEHRTRDAVLTPASTLPRRLLMSKQSTGQWEMSAEQQQPS